MIEKLMQAIDYGNFENDIFFAIYQLPAIF